MNATKAERWLLIYADLITVLLIVFVVAYSLLVQRPLAAETGSTLLVTQQERDAVLHLIPWLSALVILGAVFGSWYVRRLRARASVDRTSDIDE